jgi:hypothetical protein
LDDLRAEFGLEIDYTGSTLGFEFFVSRISTGVRRATFLGTAMALPVDERVRTLAITEPAPAFPWWAIWRRHVPRHLIHRLLDGMTADSRPTPAVPDSAQVWIPRLDRAYLTEDAHKHHQREAG